MCTPRHVNVNLHENVHYESEKNKTYEHMQYQYSLLESVTLVPAKVTSPNVTDFQKNFSVRLSSKYLQQKHV